MKRRKKLDLSFEDAATQRAIARSLKRGLPLAGLLAAALFCGCDEQPSDGLMGIPAPPPGKLTEATPPDNRPNERPEFRLQGKPLPPEEKANPPDNSGNENKRCRPLSREPIVLKEKADK